MNVDIIVGILMVFFTASIAYFAYRQYRLGRRRLKIKASPPYKRIYHALEEYINILDIGTISEQRNALRFLREETKDVRFLFKKSEGIVKLKDKLLSKGLEIIQIQEKLEGNSLSNEEKDKLINEEKQLMKWIRKQGAVIVSKFEKYLQLS